MLQNSLTQDGKEGTRKIKDSKLGGKIADDREKNERGRFLNHLKSFKLQVKEPNSKYVKI